MNDFKQILAPADGSEGSRNAVRMAARLGRGLGIPVKLTYVVPLTPEDVVSLASLDRSEVEATRNRWGEQVLEQAREHLDDVTGVDNLILTGDAATEILNYLDTNPGTLVVMGRRGLSPIKNLMLGSVSEKVLRHGNGAVMVVG